MTEAIMAKPELRNPYPKRELDSGVTVLYNGKSHHLTQYKLDDSLHILPEDLSRVNGFELKPEGACFESLCFPLPVDNAILSEIDGQQWFNLTAFADWLEQPYVADTQHRAFSFGEIPAKRDSLLADAQAPDFEVTDRQGNVVRMTDLKGKKALIITWSSW